MIKAEPHAQVLAIGTSGNGNDFTDGRPIIAQLSGRSWEVQEYATNESFTVGQAVIINRKNIWAIQEDAHLWGISVEYWNGDQWQKTALPPASEGHVYTLNAIDGANGTIWAVGADLALSAKRASSTLLALRWNGDAWTLLQIPMPSDGRNQLKECVARVRADLNMRIFISHRRKGCCSLCSMVQYVHALARRFSHRLIEQEITPHTSAIDVLPAM